MTAPYIPRAPGVNPQPPQPVQGLLGPPPQSRSIFDRIGSNLFGTGGLDDATRAQANRQGLLGIGTSLLRSSGPSTTPVGLGQAIGEAIPQGQAQAFQASQDAQALQAQQTEAARAQQRQAIFAKYAGASDAGSLRNLFQELVAFGDVEAARPVSEVLKSLEGGTGSTRLETVINPETGLPEIARIGNTGVPEFLGVAPPESTDRNYQLRTVLDETGRPILARVDTNTGEVIPTSAAVPATASEDERKSLFFSEFLSAEEPSFEQFGGAPGRFESAAQNLGGREVTSPELQLMDAAGKMYAEAWLRKTTGAAYSQTEFNTAYSLFVPQPGDSPATLQAKYNRRERLRNALRTAGSRAARMVGQSSGPSPSAPAATAAPPSIPTAEAIRRARERRQR